MRSRKPPQAKSGVSRRGFIRNTSLGAGVIGTGVLAPPLDAQQASKVAGPGPVPITLQVNGQPRKLNVEPRLSLLDALRDHLDLTGAKKVCDRGNCGACTVMINGKAVYACSVLAIDAQGKDIRTIESLTAAGKSHPLIGAFVQHDGEQCGFCTPGFVMAGKAFLDAHPNPTLADVEHGLGGNLCRCGTYMGIRQAVLQASKELKGAPRG